MRYVWNAPSVFKRTPRLFGIQRRHLGGQRVEILRLARDDGLVGQVAAADAAEKFVGKRLRRRQLERRREHAAAAELAHELAAPLHELQRRLERQRAGVHERGVLAETVAGTQARLQSVADEAAKRLEASDLVRQQRGLSEAREVQLFARVAKAELGHVVTDDLAGTRVEHLARRGTPRRGRNPCLDTANPAPERRRESSYRPRATMP